MVKAKRPSVATTWPTRRAAAAELGVIMNQPGTSEETLKSWLNDPACPLPRGRGPIPKIPLLVWIISAKRGPGRPADASSSAIKSAQAAIFQAKADAIAGRMVKLEDVNNAVDAAVDELKRDITEEIPATVGAMIGTRTADDITEEHKALATAALNRFSASARTVKK